MTTEMRKMQKISFETTHISEENMMAYISLRNLSGENKEFAKRVQNHLCVCEACRGKMMLFEKLSESAKALESYERAARLAGECDLINARSASAEFSRLVRGASENSGKKVSENSFIKTVE